MLSSEPLFMMTPKKPLLDDVQCVTRLLSESLNRLMPLKVGLHRSECTASG
jgi:hypothetical protein